MPFRSMLPPGTGSGRHLQLLLGLQLCICSLACRHEPPPEPRSASLPAPPASPFAVEVTRLGERVAMLSCLEVNVTALHSDRGVVLIDSHRSPASMAAVLAVLETRLGWSGVSHLVNSHGHWDHSAGNQLFADAVIAGHTGCPEQMRRSPAVLQRTLWYLQRDAAASGSAAWQRVLDSLQQECTVTPPTTLVDGHLTLDAGGQELLLIDAAGGHSGSDLLVYVPAERLVHTGDIVCGPDTPCFPVDAASEVPRIVAALDQVLAAGVDTVIRGHGPPLTGSDLQTFRDSLLARFNGHEERARAARQLQELLPAAGAAAAIDTACATSSEAPCCFSDGELDRLAWRRYEEGSVGQALDLFAAAIDRYPDSALLHDSLAEARLRTGDLAGARAGFRRALELNQWNTFAKAKLEQLECEWPLPTPSQ